MISSRHRLRADIPIAAVIRELAKDIPSAPAITETSSVWSYSELDEQSARVAHSVNEAAAPHSRIAVSGTTSFALIAALLGVLRAGRVIVPIDSSLPKRRRAAVRRAANVALTITAERPPFDDVSSLSLTGETLSDASLAIPPGATTDDAYVFFTSGTTGEPKAILGTHAGLSHFLGWQQRTFTVGQGDRVGQLTGLSFDVVLRDIFLPLVSGATLCLPSFSSRAGAVVLPWLADERITLLHTVPALALSWLQDETEPPPLEALRAVFFAGEPLTASLVSSWRERLAFTGRIVNLYGPTETTLAKCFYVVPDPPEPGIQPVGVELPDTQLIVLSPDGRECSTNEEGEFVIRTPYRTRGYLGGDESDNHRFGPNPLTGDAHDIVYFTGDLGYRRPDGFLQLTGRVDDQVKIHGVRVNPREIESALLRNPNVRQAAILVDNEGEQKRLLAFATVRFGWQPSALREAVVDLVPADLPIQAEVMPTLPLGPNGKVDRLQLLSMARNRHRPSERTSETGATPRGSEDRIKAIWRQFLGGAGDSLNDDFFASGGDSLTAMRLAAQVEKELEITCSAADLFKHPTLAGFIAHLGASRRSAPPVSSGWLVRWHVPERPTFRLFAIGHAGAGAARFRRWKSAFSMANGELVALRLPGREGRLEEPPIEKLDDLAREACDAIEPLTTQPFALFGHCSGALVAHAIVRELRRRNLPLPYLLATAGELGPRAAGEFYRSRKVPASLRERVRSLGGTDMAILGNAALLKALTPALQADFKLIDSYTYTAASPLDTSIAVLTGSDDMLTDPAGVLTWADESSRPLLQRTVAGDHFFSGDAWSELGTAVAQIATEQIQAPEPPVSAQD